jgi:hypothetical protein
MNSLAEIYQFINSFRENSSDLKDYYDKCYDALKEIIKRSRLLSFVLIVLFALNSFSDHIKEFEIIGFKIDKDLIKITTPLLISYLVLEWCLLARRRRELQKLMKHIGFKLFPITRIEDDLIFNHFSLQSRNIMPFSFTIEFLNIEYRALLNSMLLLLAILILFLAMPAYTGYLLYISFTAFRQSFPTLLCNLVSIYFFIHIVLFYKHEVIVLIRTERADRAFKHLLSGNASNPID